MIIFPLSMSWNLKNNKLVKEGAFALVKLKKITRITVLVFLVIIFLISCNSSTQNYTGSSIDEEDTSESIVPDWLYQSLLEKF